MNKIKVGGALLVSTLAMQPIPVGAQSAIEQLGMATRTDTTPVIQEVQQLKENPATLAPAPLWDPEPKRPGTVRNLMVCYSIDPLNPDFTVTVGPVVARIKNQPEISLHGVRFHIGFYRELVLAIGQGRVTETWADLALRTLNYTGSLKAVKVRDGRWTATVKIAAVHMQLSCSEGK